HRKQAADIEVFASLRLDGFVGRDHQEHQINAADSSQHVAYEAFVPWHIYEPHPQHLAIGYRQLKIGKANIDRDTAAFLFFQAISIDAGERLHQRGLAVVDVACRTYDDGLHWGQYSWDAVSSAVQPPFVILSRVAIASRRQRSRRTPSKPVAGIAMSGN